MIIEKIERKKGIEANKKLTKAYDRMQALIEALGKKEISADELNFINVRLQFINSFTGSDEELTKTLKKTYSQIIKFIKEKLDFVPKNHYLRLGVAYGLLAGVVFSSVFNSFGFMGLGSSQAMGISMGMLFGIIIGTHFDKQAAKKGNQLDI